MSHIKLSWRNIIIAATLPAVMEVIWQLYNTYVPVYLQAGNPAFTEAGATTVSGGDAGIEGEEGSGSAWGASVGASQRHCV